MPRAQLNEAHQTLEKKYAYLEKKSQDELEKAKAYNKQGNKKGMKGTRRIVALMSLIRLYFLQRLSHP